LPPTGACSTQGCGAYGQHFPPKRCGGEKPARAERVFFGPPLVKHHPFPPGTLLVSPAPPAKNRPPWWEISPPSPRGVPLSSTNTGVGRLFHLPTQSRRTIFGAPSSSQHQRFDGRSFYLQPQIATLPPPGGQTI